MKKNYIFTLLLIFSLSFISFGQEMIVNGGLENWDDATSPTGWSKAESLTQEATEMYSGTYSAVRNGGSGTKKLGQTITGIVPGNSYTISFWYKATAGDDTNVRIWSNWKNGSDNVYHVGDVNDRSNDPLRGPNNGYLDNNGGAWTKHDVTVTAPAGVDAFYYEVRSYSESITYWDDLSFLNTTTASLKNNAIEGFAIYPNPITNNKFTLTTASTAEKNVNVFNLLGKKVLSTSFSGLKSTFDVATITAGIYILKVTEAGKTATRKLVIR